jgi:hypothetical protein
LALENQDCQDQEVNHAGFQDDNCSQENREVGCAHDATKKIDTVQNQDANNYQEMHHNGREGCRKPKTNHSGKRTSFVKKKLKGKKRSLSGVHVAEVPCDENQNVPDVSVPNVEQSAENCKQVAREEDRGPNEKEISKPRDQRRIDVKGSRIVRPGTRSNITRSRNRKAGKGNSPVSQSEDDMTQSSNSEDKISEDNAEEQARRNEENDKEATGIKEPPNTKTQRSKHSKQNKENTDISEASHAKSHHTKPRKEVDQRTETTNLNPKSKRTTSGNETATESATSSDPLEPGKSTKKSERPFFCCVCDKRWPTGCKLRKHLKYHPGYEQAIFCRVCSEYFPSAAAVEAHQETHKVLHACKVCGKVLKNRSTLILHMASHTTERPHQCKLCPRTFKTAKVSTCGYCTCGY